jgi:hypothetical protein
MQSQRQTQPDQGMSFTEKMNVMRGLMGFPALTVMVFLRRNLGYRFLHVGHIFAMSGILFIVGTLATDSPNHEGLILFALLIPVFGLAQRFRRWLEMRRGIRQHSFYIGDSIFESKRTPKFLRRRLIARFFDPLFCVFGGLALGNVCPLLGLWLILSGFALRVLEHTVYVKELNRDLDTMDGMIVSEVQADTVDHFSESPAEVRQQEQNREGIATGLSEDIQGKIKHRSQARRH